MTRSNQKFFLVVKSMNANEDPEKTTLGDVDVTMALLSYERLSTPPHTHMHVHTYVYYMKRKTNSDGSDVL